MFNSSLAILETKVVLTLEAIKVSKVEIPFPRKLPGLFEERINVRTPLSRLYQGSKSGFNSNSIITVVTSVMLESDGHLWYHVSLSKRNKTIPSYEDLQYVKKHWIGDDRWAIQIFPEKEKHVNLVNALHLWHCLEGNPLPDFRNMGMI